MAWWHVAQQAAKVLRDHFGVQRVAVIGDLVRPEPLHFWSEMTLVAWGLPQDHYAIRACIFCSGVQGLRFTVLFIG